MAGLKAKSPCEHGLNDEVEITDKTVLDDYRHRTHTVVYGYWCRTHGAFGNYMVKEVNYQFPPRETTAPPAAC